MTALWPHQRDALAVLRNHFSRNERSKSALVSMPTGSGKSAVIASVLADPEVGASCGSALILAPWRALASQLKEDLDSRVWRNLGIERPKSLSPVRQVRSARDFTDRLCVVGPQPTVYVTTMAMVLEVFKQLENDPLEMGALFASFSSIIVDECHYEPAPSWSIAVRATGLPTALFTATPFRNDNRYFDLEDDAQYRYSHAQAEDDRVLRRAHFEQLHWTGGEAGFVHALVTRLKGLELDDSARVIVRCGSRTSVEAVTRALRAAGEDAVGFHETFEAGLRKHGLLRSVPSPNSRPSARFWVHQHKLTEGFDDPAAVVLAVFDGFSNDRSRIQQIGRILRNPARGEGARAYIFAADDEMESAWARYRRFDEGEAPRSMTSDPAGIEALLTAQPETFYWDRLFRDSVDLHADTAWQNIKYRLSAAVRVPKSPINIDDLTEAVRANLIENDRRILSVGAPLAETRVFLHLAVSNSPILRTGAFVEMTLGYTVLHWDGARLFVSDTTTALPKAVRDLTNPVDAGSLVSLLPADARVSEVSLTNNDLGQWSVRNRSLSARNLDRVASELGDTTFGYATALGHLNINGDTVTRYTGVRNARVRDQRPSEGRFSDLHAWFQEIANGLSAKATPSRAITRYSAPVAAPADPKAAHILIALDPGSFSAIAGSDPLVINDYGDSVGKDGTFVVTINDQQIHAHVRWVDSTRRFEVSSSTHVPYRDENGDSFWQHINRQQALRVATTDQLVYANGNFWSLGLHGRNAGLGLLSLLTGRIEMNEVTEEKGDPSNSGRWSNGTVFGLVDNILLPEVLGDDATVLCTDMGHEIADFIGFNDTKVIFVHAKSSSLAKRTHVSGSALHEVISQAVKNLRYLTIGNEDTPAFQSWTKLWNDGKHVKTSRHRRGAASNSGADYWSRINRITQSHGAEREVWLVLGNSLSLTALKTNLNKPQPNAPAVQAYGLLTSAWSAAQQCGVRLRVICSE